MSRNPSEIREHVKGWGISLRSEPRLTEMVSDGIDFVGRIGDEAPGHALRAATADSACSWRRVCRGLHYTHVFCNAGSGCNFPWKEVFPSAARSLLTLFPFMFLLFLWFPGVFYCLLTTHPLTYDSSRCFSFRHARAAWNGGAGAVFRA
jgi:hypothetical protein